MDKYITGSNSDSESIPCKERNEKWITDYENIFKALKKPADENSFNSGGKKVDIKTPGTGKICYSFLITVKFFNI